MNAIRQQLLKQGVIKPNPVARPKDQQQAIAARRAELNKGSKKC